MTAAAPRGLRATITIDFPSSMNRDVVEMHATQVVQNIRRLYNYSRGAPQHAAPLITLELEEEQ